MDDNVGPVPPTPPNPPTAPMPQVPIGYQAPPLPPGYQAPPVPPPPAPGQPDAKKSHAGLWVGLGVGAGVIGVAVVVLLFVFAWSGTSAGASSPQAAVDDMVHALETKDVASALAGLAPGELTGIDDLWRTAQSKSDQLGGGGDAPKVTGDALVFEPRKVKWDVEELSDNTARATLTDVDLTVGFDTATLDLTTEQKDQLEDLDPDQVDGSRYLWNLTTGDLPSEGVTVMTVKRDGGWFVSPLYTIGEYGYQGSRKAQRRGAPDYAYDPDKVSSGAATPSDAVRALAAAVGSGTETDIVDLLAPRQLAFAQVYHVFGDSPAAGSDVSVDNLVLAEEPLGEGRTRVRLQQLDVKWRNGSVEVDGACWQAETQSRKGGPTTRKGCLQDLLPEGSEGLAHLLPSSASVVAIEQDGKWYVDPLQSATVMVGDFVNALGTGDVDQIQDMVKDLQKLDYDED